MLGPVSALSFPKTTSSIRGQQANGVEPLSNGTFRAWAIRASLDGVADRDLSTQDLKDISSSQTVFIKSICKSQCLKILITFGDICPRNGYKSDLTAPRTTLG